jgi:hypothetical protein
MKFQSKVALWVSVSCLTLAISIASAWAMSQAGSSDNSSASKPAAAGNSGATANQAPAASANTPSKSASTRRPACDYKDRWNQTTLPIAF